MSTRSLLNYLDCFNTAHHGHVQATENSFIPGWKMYASLVNFDVYLSLVAGN